MAPTQADEQAIFEAARKIASRESREAYVRDMCGDDDALQQRVAALLRAYDQSKSFLESPPLGFARHPFEDIDGPTVDRPISEGPGTVIGTYKLLQQIGEGGMGVVFMAEQTEPLQRTVALKIIKPGMDTRQVIARFEAERQAVAMMDHPNIAKVLDAGTTDSGRPYFVMELVKGVPITKYCDEKHLPLRARLELFIQVCQAVQHAHQKGIIHRDIKPNNVLVAEYDNRAVPKVIDFGVAKATAHRLTERTMFTEFGQVLGTMEYMSPEQSKFNQLDIDTRSDIYSLGVLLYELLAGSTPFEGKRLHAAAFDEMLRIIREEEPPKPSTRLSSLSSRERAIDSLPLAGRVGEGVTSSLASIAANRQTEPARLSKDVQGELDWIVMKALEKDRSRRYETASGFAADIERHLRDEPVEAGPPSAAYRFRKFAKRNKAALIAGSVVAAALFLGLIGTTWQAIRATHAERVTQVQRDRALRAEKQAKAESARANQAAAVATAVNEFLNKDLLAQANPMVEPDREIKLRLVLDRAAQKIETRFPDQPLVEAAIRMTLGTTYATLGEWLEAERHLKRARELHLRELGEEHAATIQSTSHLAWVYTNWGFVERNPQMMEEGRKLLVQTLALRRRTLGEEHPDTLRSAISLASTLDLQERTAEGIVLMEPLLPLFRRTWGGDEQDTLKWMNVQANMLRKVDRGKEALQLYQQALDVSRRNHGKDHPSTLTLEDNVAISLALEGRTEEAVKLHVSVVDARRRVLGEGNPWTTWSIWCLRNDVRDLSSAPQDAARAVELAQEIVAAAPTSGAAWTALGMAQYEAGDWSAAIDALEKSMEVRNGRSGIDWFLLSMAHSQLGDADTARKWYDQAAEWMDKNQPNNVHVREFRAPAEELLKIADQKPNAKPQSK